MGYYAAASRSTRCGKRCGHRAAFSLIEVIVAMAIFLMSLAAIVSLVTLGGHNAMQARNQSRALSLANAKMAEVIGGSLPFGQSISQQSLGGEPDNAPDFLCSVSFDSPSFQGLSAIPSELQSDFMSVTVTIYHKEGGDTPEECCSLVQMVLAPKQRAHTLDSVFAATQMASQSASTGTKSGGGGGGTKAGTGTGGGRGGNTGTGGGRGGSAGIGGGGGMPAGGAAGGMPAGGGSKAGGG